MKINNPELIDIIVQQNIAQGTKQDFSGKWFIAKPHELGGLFGLRKRIKHAYLVFKGKAQAYQFYEDIANAKTIKKPINYPRIIRFMGFLLKDIAKSIGVIILTILVASVVFAESILVGYIVNKLAFSIFVDKFSWDSVVLPQLLMIGVFTNIPLLLAFIFGSEYIDKLWRRSHV